MYKLMGLSTLLLKAMYGCVQASKLWYNLLVKILGSRGYVVSETDTCVMRRAINRMIFIILIYVDDLLIFAMNDEIEGIRELLAGVFKLITMELVKSSHICECR